MIKITPGFVSGKLTVLNKNGKSKSGNILWSCKCECGNIKSVSGSHLKNKTTKSCGCLQFIGHKKLNPKWPSYGDITGDFWHSLNRNANGSKGRKAKEFTITIEYIWNLFLKQNKKCALSGLLLTINYRNNRLSSKNPKLRIEHTASLDRIDSSKGYIPGNVQWIHKQINLMKNNLSDSDFIEWCHLISKYNTKSATI